MSEAQICRFCGSSDVMDLGTIPDSDYFAGRVLLKPLAGGHLFRCRACSGMFRYPILSLSQYLELYKHGNPTQWTGGSDRQDLRIVKSMIVAEPDSRKVLDIGCGSGEFLFSLPIQFQKFGIEPSAAARLAELRGIEIVAQQIETVPVDAQFNVITIIDVIEHIIDPSSLLTNAYSHLIPGGKIIISTGDPTNFIWRRIFKSRFWYVGFPEHITFPSVEFYRNWCETLDAVLDRKLVIRYQLLSVPWSALNLLMQIAYFISPAAFSWVGRVGAWFRALPTPRRQTFSPGIPGLFSDHHILVLTKPHT